MAKAICGYCGAVYGNMPGSQAEGPLEEIEGLAQSMGGWQRSLATGKLACRGCRRKAIAEDQAVKGPAPAVLEVPEGMQDPREVLKGIVAKAGPVAAPAKVWVVVTAEAICGVFADERKARELAEMVAGLRGSRAVVQAWEVGQFGYKALKEPVAEESSLGDDLTQRLHLLGRTCAICASHTSNGGLCSPETGCCVCIDPDKRDAWRAVGSPKAELEASRKTRVCDTCGLHSDCGGGIEKCAAPVGTCRSGSAWIPVPTEPGNAVEAAKEEVVP